MLKIGIVGVGNVGRSVAELLQRAGHELRLGSRQPHEDVSLPSGVGTSADAAAFGELVFCAVPYGAWPELARDLASHVRGKIVVDASNPSPRRDGAFAEDVLDGGEGSGVPVAKLLPQAKLVRAFNSVPWPSMLAEADRPGARIAIPLAGDDADARRVVASMVREAGFDPVDAGSLRCARAFDPGTPAYNRPMSATQMRCALALA